MLLTILCLSTKLRDKMCSTQKIHKVQRVEALLVIELVLTYSAFTLETRWDRLECSTIQMAAACLSAFKPTYIRMLYHLSIIGII